MGGISPNPIYPSFFNIFFQAIFGAGVRSKSTWLARLFMEIER
jgi:hypothetical protein